MHGAEPVQHHRGRPDEPKDVNNDKNYLVLGPWRHSQVNYDAYNLGVFKWDGDTATQFRRDVLRPFFDQYLKDGPKADTPPVLIYDPARTSGTATRPGRRARPRTSIWKPMAASASRRRRRPRARRPMTSTSPTRPSPCRTSRARCSSAIAAAGRPGWSATSAAWSIVPTS